MSGYSGAGIFVVRLYDINRIHNDDDGSVGFDGHCDIMWFLRQNVSLSVLGDNLM